MKTLLIILVLIMLIFTLAGCAARPNESVNKPVETGEVAGFWQGLWHGLISPFAFIVSLFRNDVGIYDLHNNGGWYNFGFILGVAAIFGGGGRGSHRRS
jgi:hypothetical protein